MKHFCDFWPLESIMRSNVATRLSKAIIYIYLPLYNKIHYNYIKKLKLKQK